MMRKTVRRILIAGLTVMLTASSVFAGDSYASMSGVGSTRYHNYSSDDYIIIDGVDVSAYQSLSASDWKKLKNAGIDYAFIRTSGTYYGSNKHTTYDDYKFEDNYNNAKAAGMMLGTYHYTSAITKSEAQKEAKKSLEIIDERDLDLPIVFDSECNFDRCHNLRYNGGKRIDFALAFDDYIRSNSDYTTMYYSYLNMMNTEPGFKANLSKLTKAMPLWVAQYNSTCDYSGDYAFWQHTSSAYFNSGTIGPLDCNFWYFKRDSKITNSTTKEECKVKSLATYKYYKGYALKPKVKVTCGGKTLVEGTDYKVNYVKNVKVGRGYAIVIGLGDYSGQAAAGFRIYKQSIKKAVVSGFDNGYAYTGSEITPKPVVTLGNKTLVKDKHYTLSYSNNLNAGKATVTVKGTGIYTGSVSASFEIDRAPLDPDKFELKDAAYTGEAVSPKVVTDYQSEDYTIKCHNNVELGTATATITGKGNCTGSFTKEFNIYLPATKSLTPKLYGMHDIKVSWKKVTGAERYLVYYKYGEMNAYKKLDKIKETSINLPKGEAGTKYCFKVIPCRIVDGKEYKGKAKISNIYTMKRISKPSIKKSGSQLEISWDKVDGADGYEISKSTSRFKANPTYDFAGDSTCSRKISAKTNTKYYYKVRAYKEYDGKRVYATWSPVRAFTKY